MPTVVCLFLFRHPVFLPLGEIVVDSQDHAVTNMGQLPIRQVDSLIISY
jgi:hypothetical protein